MKPILEKRQVRNTAAILANEIVSDAIKAGDIRDQAAKALQGAIKRKRSQNQLNNIYEAKEQIAGRAKALLTTKATFGKVQKGKKAGQIFVANTKRVGKPLIVRVHNTLVGKKASQAARESEAIKREFKGLQAKYSESGIMKP